MISRETLEISRPEVGTRGFLARHITPLQILLGRGVICGRLCRQRHSVLWTNKTNPPSMSFTYDIDISKNLGQTHFPRAPSTPANKRNNAILPSPERHSISLENNNLLPTLVLTTSHEEEYKPPTPPPSTPTPLSSSTSPSSPHPFPVPLPQEPFPLSTPPFHFPLPTPPFPPHPPQTPPSHLKMCQTGFNHFCCGCSTPIEGTLKQCELIKLQTGGRHPHACCPDYQVTERRSKSKTWMMPCMAHSG